MVSSSNSVVRKRIVTPEGTAISYRKSGEGPPLVLVHGGFSDDVTNWEFVEPILRKRFTLYAIARRGRGESDATEGHGVEDEGRDIVSLIQAVGEPVFLLGHSYGGQCSLAAARMAPRSIRKLVLYEPPFPSALPRKVLAPLEELAASGAWHDFALSFFRDALRVPIGELVQLTATDLWPPIVADAKASLGDLRALVRYDFDAGRFSSLDVPVLLQIGSESPRDLYVTHALAAVLPDARIQVLEGQAHEGMTTAPEMYADAVIRFLLHES
jgi:pimeloyl-ACP methyl ester carboxylesterase